MVMTFAQKNHFQLEKISILDPISVISLGQSGFRLEMENFVIYIDPYLSHSVEKIEGKDYKRQILIWKEPKFIDDANLVLITHIHLDHCDLETLIPIANTSASCSFVGPKQVCDYLYYNGLNRDRLIPAPTNWLKLHSKIKLCAIPSAHPAIECDANGYWKYVGYLLEFNNKKIYHSGDTSLDKQLINYISQFKPIDTAFLPVNEKNYMRNADGIIGNMGIRDAFYLAELLRAEKLVPMHWDMFFLNSVFREEIELCYKFLKPNFQLLINPTMI